MWVSPSEWRGFPVDADHDPRQSGMASAGAQIDRPVHERDAARSADNVAERHPEQIVRETADRDGGTGRHPDRDQIHMGDRILETEREKSRYRPSDRQALARHIAR